MLDKRPHHPEVIRIRALLDATDSTRALVSGAIKAELNGHMSGRHRGAAMVLSDPRTCDSCGVLYLERRSPGKAGYGTCSRDCQLDLEGLDR